MDKEKDLFTIENDAVKLPDNQGTTSTDIQQFTGTESLLQLAISKDIDLNKLEKLIEMKNREEERACKKDFDFHFSEMQKDYTPATKTGEVLNKEGSKILYKFCSLEDILKVYSPVIAKHGFSFRWKETMKDDKTKVVSCIVSGYGHEESTPVEIPIEPGNSFTNSIQQRGVSTSYGKRYSFINAFGVIIEDEDNDANFSFDDGVMYSQHIISLENCDTRESLITTWKDIYKKLEGDEKGREIAGRTYAKKKQELSK